VKETLRAEKDRLLHVFFEKPLSQPRGLHSPIAPMLALGLHRSRLAESSLLADAPEPSTAISAFTAAN
jgi:hypothetical protein